MIWSISESKTFKRCQRQWYFKNCVASALAKKDPIRREAYLLSKLQTISGWRGQIVDSVLSEITRAEVLRDAFYLVESLPNQCRKIVLMSFVVGMSNQQIARRLQLSIHTVRNQKVRGIQLMRNWAKACA